MNATIQNMTDDEIRVRIEEVCGWRKGVMAQAGYTGEAWQHLSDPTFYRNPPDYLNDLNACAEFEQTLEPAQFARYAHQVSLSPVPPLDEEANRPNPIASTLFHRFGWYGLLRATARQRAEAFLATITAI